MSRIIKKKICDSCGHIWEGYISFGHPKKSFYHDWKCKYCGKENKILIKEWINSDGIQNDVVIHWNDISFTRIFRFIDGLNAEPIPLDEFVWNRFEGRDGNLTEDFTTWLTLEDISNQLKEKYKSIGVFYVWSEQPLYGAIYQFNNYSDNNWYLHAKTNGYA